MIIGFTGTQHGMTLAQLEAVQQLLNIIDPEEVHHGDCIGADADFDRLAHEAKIDVLIHPPIKEAKRAFCWGAKHMYPARDYIPRDHDIVDAADRMIATPHGYEEELRSGTWATIRYTRKCAKPLYLVWPDGKVTQE